MVEQGDSVRITIAWKSSSISLRSSYSLLNLIPVKTDYDVVVDNRYGNCPFPGQLDHFIKGLRVARDVGFLVRYAFF